MFSKIKEKIRLRKINKLARKIAEEIKALSIEEMKEGLERCKRFLNSIGLVENRDFQIKICKWFDYEVEGWECPQLKVKIFKTGEEKLKVKGLNKFFLLEKLTLIVEDLPKEVYVEVE